MAWRDIKKFLYPLAVMVNTTIGVGIFALPYAAAKVGIPLALAYLVGLCAIVTAVHFMFAELSLKTADYKRLIAFSRIYLGKWGQAVAAVTTLVGFFGSLVAFMIIGGQFLYQLLNPFLGGSAVSYSLLYLVAGSIFILLGINLVSKIEFWGLTLFFAILMLVGIKGLPLFSFQNIAARTGSFGDIIFPYGPILFAFWASSSIPEIEEMLGRVRGKKMLKGVILGSSLIALATYAFFIILIVGISGPATSESALIGLRQILGTDVAQVLLFLGFITTFTTFIIMGLTLKKILAYDLRINKSISWSLTVAVPATLLLVGLKDFTTIFSIVGGVLLGIDGILILLMYQKIRPDRKPMTYPLLLIFIGGIIYELVYYLK